MQNRVLLLCLKPDQVNRKKINLSLHFCGFISIHGVCGFDYAENKREFVRIKMLSENYNVQVRPNFCVCVFVCVCVFMNAWLGLPTNIYLDNCC